METLPLLLPLRLLHHKFSSNALNIFFSQFSTMDPTPPPPYTSTSTVTPRHDQLSASAQSPITLLLLGPPQSGKTTFLSRLPHLHHLPCLPPLSPTLHHLRPLPFTATLFNRPYPIHIYPNTSALFIDEYPAAPSLVVLCFAIDDRHSLDLATGYWRRQLSVHYAGHEMPLLLLGLKRDARHTGRIREEGVYSNVDDRDEIDESRYECVMPEEGLQAAVEIRADRYAECSAVTGELLWEVVEDITRMAAGTRTAGGGFSEYGGAGGMCIVI